MTLQTPSRCTSSRNASAFAYDVFVIHASADEWFVQGYLLASAGLPAERVLVFNALALGELITTEIERGVRWSRVTIVVLSPALMDDRLAEFAEQIAGYATMAKSVHGVLLPLLLDDCELPNRIRALVKLDFRCTERDAWKVEIDRLRAYLDCPVIPDADLRCPYPGMRPYAVDDAGLFFGRELEIDRIIRRLQRGEREIYVIGASGSGKSSLIGAGLVPRLTAGVVGLPSFHVKTIRPGDRPIDRLAAALQPDPAAPAALDGPAFGPRPSGISLLLVVDQLEEIFVMASESQRQAFFASVRALRTDPHCAMVFTLRADFYAEFMRCPLWTDHDGAIARVDLAQLDVASLQTAIERPARDIGVYFQRELISRLVDEASGEPGALPLLQETLVRLWAMRRGHLLTLADYEALGDETRTGLAFAVKEHADFVLDTLTGPQKRIAMRLLLRLVAFGEGRADTRRQQSQDALRSHAETDFDVVLQRLVDHRLVTISGDDRTGDVTVDLAHELLLSAWPALANWIRAWRSDEQRRRRFEAAAAAWRARGSRDGGLFDAVELADAVAWRVAAGSSLGQSTDLVAFLTSSEIHMRAT